MYCLHCHGLLVTDHLFDKHGTTGRIAWRRSRRCMYCGHVDDAESHYPRAADAIQPAAPSSEPDYHDEEVHLGRESYLARAI